MEFNTPHPSSPNDFVTALKLTTEGRIVRINIPIIIIIMIIIIINIIIYSILTKLS